MIIDTLETSTDFDRDSLDSIEDLINDLARSERLPELIEALASRGVHVSANYSEVVVYILTEIIFSENARLTAECLALAFGFQFRENLTLTSIADKYGLTRQNISKKVLEIVDRFKLPPRAAVKAKRLAKSISFPITDHANRNKQKPNQ